jgi:restriction system protein
MFSILKGWFGEKQTQFGMWLKLGDEYIRFHDVIVPTPNGTTQIEGFAIQESSTIENMKQC